LFAVLEESFEGGRLGFERAAEATDELGSERLEDEAVVFLNEGDLSAFADGVFAAEFCGDDELAFGGDGGEFSFHKIARFVAQRRKSIP